MAPLTAAMRFDRAWNGCKCRGECECMVCQACMTKELRDARLDAFAEAAGALCQLCGDGHQPKEGSHAVAEGTAVFCSAWPVRLLAAAAEKAESQ